MPRETIITPSAMPELDLQELRSRYAEIDRDNVELKKELTRRLEEQTTLAESEATLRAFLESAAQGVVAVDADGKIILVNGKTEEMFGYTRVHLLGQPLEILLPEHLRAGHCAHRAGYFARPHVRPMGVGLDLAGRRKDGSEFPVEISLSFIDVGGRRLALGFITDITERKRVEQQITASLEALRKSEGTVRALLESASQGVVATDRTGRIILVNAKTERMFGYTREEILGQQLEILLPEKFRESHVHHRGAYALQPRERSMGLGLNLAARRKDGSEFPVEISLSFVQSEDGILAISFITDITERKRFDEQLWQTQKLESLGILAGGVAHDFNNLLTGIMSGASFALDTLPEDHPARSVLETVTRASERAASLTRQLLAYSGKGKFIVEPVDLSSLVREIVGLIQTSIPKTVQLRLDLVRYLPLIEVDSIQIQQLVMNLVINGAEAIGENVGTVAVKTGLEDVGSADAHVLVRGMEIRAGKYVFLEVADTGCGMDATTKLRIFDPFFTTKATGRGLGLAAVLGIVRGHHGAVRVNSAPHQGTTFRILLPVTQASDAETDNDVVQRLSKGTILVVDDEDVVRVVAKATLERAGYAVVLAEDGREAVELFARIGHQIALVLLDMHMPEIAGMDVLQNLEAIRPDVRVLVSSGYSEVEVLRSFSGKGPVGGFIQKPYKSSRLLEAVEAVLETKRL
jgi:PAS domain S-box-containing protein